MQFIIYIIFSRNYLILYCLFLYLSVGAQCPDVFLKTQNDVDSFFIKNPTCASIKSLTISGSNITNLKGLSNLRSIDHTLRLEDLPLLTSLLPLANIKSTLYSLSIVNCPAIESLEGLDKITVNGNNFSLISLELKQLKAPIHIEKVTWFTIENCPALVDLEPLNVDTIRTQLVNYCEALTNVNVLENASQITVFEIKNCISLNSLPNFKNINNLSTLALESCDNLQYFQDFTSREIMIQSLLLKNNANLLSLNGLNARINPMWKSKIVFSNNPKLNDISQLDKWDNSNLDSIIISNNPNLNTCHLEWVCNYSSLFPLKTIINRNSGDCLNLESVRIKCLTLANYDEYSDDIKNASIFYPNPAQDLINLYPSWKDKKIQIFDANGTLVYSKVANCPNFEISHLAPGIYYMKASGNKKCNYQKFIKL
jgi:hypothetical protein